MKLGLDIVGPFETAAYDCRYAITLTDYYSKWPEVAFTPSITTSVVIGFLNSVFSRHGNPECLVTDNGPQLTSSIFTAFLDEWNIVHTKTSVYHPAANGAVERFNKVLKDCVQMAVLQKRPWKQAVLDFLQTYRSTPHAMTGVSPFELLYRRKMRTKLTVFTPHSSNTQDQEVRQRVSIRQNKMKQYSDAKRGARVPTFQVGNRVRVRKPMHVPKGHSKFTQPVEIEKQVGPSTYRLADGRLWHSSHLSLVPEVLKPTSDLSAADVSVTNVLNTEQSTERRSVRQHKPPFWMKDYESK